MTDKLKLTRNYNYCNLCDNYYCVPARRYAVFTQIEENNNNTLCSNL